MTRIKLVTIFIAVVGSLLYFYNLFYPPETWESHNQKGLTAFQKNRYGIAEKHFLKALKQAETLPINDHQLHFSLNQLAEIYRLQSKFTEAEKVLKRILAMDEKISGPQHPNVAITLNNLAGNYRAQGRLAESEKLLKQALALIEKKFGKDHPLTGNLLEHYAFLLHKMGRHTEAKNLENRFNEIFSRMRPEEN